MAKTDTSKMLDPMALWRDALTQWEGGAHSAATKQMGSEEFAQVLHAMASVSTGIQQALGKANGAVLKELNLPSRNDLIDIGARLQRIEDAIEQLTQRLTGVAPAPAAIEPRQMPPRTRKPPGETVRAEPVEGLRQAQPERGKAQPERGKAQPERGKAQPERGKAQPERGKAQPARKTSKRKA